MFLDTEDTITALATPPGRAALGTVRISGKKCRELLPIIFTSKKGTIVPFRPLLGKVILGNNRFIDEAILTYYETPRSYTREDLAEITCHGNPLILDELLARIVASGARLARPGEFTYRAFLNGRIDLVQAESVNDLISADSLYQVELAIQQLDGRLSERFQNLRQSFIELISLMEGNIDLSEEQHYNFIDRKEMIQRAVLLIDQVQELLGTFERGRMIREGYYVALVGKPNVGKSSLFNALLGQNRAIVTEVAGTTRDYLEERITLGNYLVHLVDTAGIRESTEVVEQEGIRRSRQVIENADLIVFVLDQSAEVTAEDGELWETVKNRDNIIVFNKLDLGRVNVIGWEGRNGLCVSAINGVGLDQLMNEIRTRIENQVKYSASDSLISSLRHKDLLQRALGALKRAEKGLTEGLTEEYPLIDLQEAVQSVGEITGEVTVEDLYTHIFRNFCIGK
ncbi:MAG: tRNA uridine-5-carboxymethylaminomethyl(34) synthesis GTPase MnmE [Acidobacteria bacterium]|nr:MAG: tRNA uridine-5-carboxymethylaminomethyl(34) synthesis GTPase MnmE [Acidobacteriota bacterium]